MTSDTGGAFVGIIEIEAEPRQAIAPSAGVVSDATLTETLVWLLGGTVDRARAIGPAGGGQLVGTRVRWTGRYRLPRRRAELRKLTAELHSALIHERQQLSARA